MRGIHDGGMPGGGTLYEKRDRLQYIIDLQRDLLANHVYPEPSQVPQIFCPYKEVLDIYQAGMNLPADITLVWPDDNFGYIRQLSNAEERVRSGGSGVYYHLSYWGRPHDYLWLDSTAPALIWHEMTKAYSLGAQQVWVVNVGDIKSIETGATLFLEMAWDIDRYGPDVQQKFQYSFYAQQFGDKLDARITALRDEYYRLCAIRKPEHMGFNHVHSKVAAENAVQDSGWSAEESQRFLARWQALATRVEEVAADLPADLRDAYFQLVEYPARAGAAMAEKILFAEQSRLSGAADAAEKARAAYDRIQHLTESYNSLGDGKWCGVMDAHPRKIPVFDMPPTTASSDAISVPPSPRHGELFVIDPTKFSRAIDHDGVGWRVVEGLGPRGAAISPLPHKDTPTLYSPSEIRAQAPMAEYPVALHPYNELEVTVEALPTHPFTPGHEVIAAVSFGDEDPILLRFDRGNDDEHDPTWQKNVRRGIVTGTVKVRVPSNSGTLKLWAADPALVVHRITLCGLGVE